MARTALTPTQLGQDAGTDVKAATVMSSIAALVALGSEIVAAKFRPDDKILIHVKNTAGTAKNITIPAGNGFRSGIGDLVVSVAATSGEAMIIVESARFAQSDGILDIDYETGFTGLIGAYRLPNVG